MLKEEELYYFNQLKKAIAQTFKESHAILSPIENWKGDEIILFQEDLFEKTKGRVSEKWFYTYIKNNPKKLPRIDILNLLSNYVGCKNWNTFKAANHKSLNKKKRKPFLRILLWLLLLFPITYMVKYTYFKNSYEFCFIDHLKNEPIKDIALDIKILKPKQTPLYLKTDSIGCFKYRANDKTIQFVVSSPYHKTDTITRYFNKRNNKTVRLKTDDYALMLKYYTNGNVKDWKTHKQKLELIFTDNAIIYQLFSNSLNVEIYTKDEFVQMITTPTSNLKNLEILDTAFKKDKIVKLKFIIK